MTKKQFIHEAVLSLLANPKVTNAHNFYNPMHHEGIRDVAVRLAETKGMSFDTE